MEQGEMKRYLTIIEVSQKQAYIFADNQLRENVRRSAEIACITSSEYMQKAVEENKIPLIVADHLVYSGGGHTILEFASEKDAKDLVRCLTNKVFKEIPEIALFAKTISYDERKTPGDNVKELTASLERKKSVRRASFHQDTFGIEEVDINTGKPKRIGGGSLKLPEQEIIIPEGFAEASRFEDLGVSKDKSSFIAVVHIDGNSMGKRVEKLADSCSDWDEYKIRMRSFSEAIAADFLDAYREMQEVVGENIKEGNLEELNLQKDGEKIMLPIRRVISEGDDICFVSEGRIGIECASIFLKALSRKTNKEDKERYSACAGVAMVHQKYPFYRAYELAEELCSNAKKFGASLGTDGTSQGISAIDWHLEYGELQDSLEETRRDYITRDKSRLELRPYIVTAPEEILKKEPIRQYQHFKTLIMKMENEQEAYGRGRLKTLRQVLKRGKDAVEHYLTFHKIRLLGVSVQNVYIKMDLKETEFGAGKEQQGTLFLNTYDGKERCLLFDVIEMMDTYLGMEDKA